MMNRIDFERLFEALPSPHMLIDRDYRYVATNAAYEQVTMRAKHELAGQCLFDLFPNDGESGRRLKASFDRVLALGETDTLAYIPYDIPRPAALGGGFEQRYWTAVHAPVKNGNGETEFLLQNAVDVTDFVRLREAASLPFRAVAGEMALIARAREAEDAQKALLDNSEAFRRLFQQAPGFFAVLSGPQHVFTFVNDAYSRLIGDRAVIGLSLRDALPELEGQGFFETLDAVYRDGERRGGEGARVMLRRSPGEPLREAVLDFSYAAIRDNSGAVTGVFVQGMDRTDSFIIRRHQRLLLNEINHRVKNTLATVQSIAAQTFRHATDIPAARKAFEKRIIALSRAHNLLAQRAWANADLETIVAQELDIFPFDRRIINGPSVALNAKSALALALVFSELTSNAARHGALSTPAGSVAVAWTIVEDAGKDRLLIRWTENGGPACEPSKHNGFGTRMIERAVTGELAGDYDSDYGENGFSCQMRLPLDIVTGADDDFA